MLKVISLFSGAGGLDLGFILSGFKVVWSNDISPSAVESYSKNLERNAVLGDVEEIDCSDIPNGDVVVGGFPCQDFSVLGGSRRQGILVKRGQLYKQFLRIVKEKQPLAFVAENVKGILSANKGLALKLIVRDFQHLEDVELEKLDELYSEESFEEMSNGSMFSFQNNETARKSAFYRIKVIRINFADYGIPQKRERVIIIGIKNSRGFCEFKLPEPIVEPSMYVSAGDVFEGKVLYGKHVSEIEQNNELLKISKKTADMLSAIPPGGNYLDLPEYLKVRGLMSSIYRRLEKDKPAYTVIANGGGGTWGYHYEFPRPLTNRERARLQTFPDWYIFSGSTGEVRTQIGNAVPPLGAIPLAFEIKRVLSGREESLKDEYYLEYEDFVAKLKEFKSGNTYAKPLYRPLEKKPAYLNQEQVKGTRKYSL